jgi:hypothetical protein
MMRYSIIAFILILITNLSLEAQNQKTSKKDDPWAEFEEEKPVRHWEMGVNFGAYFPNKYSANFYSGIPTNVNNVNYIMSNKYWYDDIKRSLNASASDVVVVAGYPTDMNYQVSIMGGLFLRYNFDHRNSLFLQANYTQLKASSVVTLEILPHPITMDPYSYAPVIGREGRVMMDLGYQHSFPVGSGINMFIQGAFTLNYTQVIESIFVVGDVEYNMVNLYGDPGYIPGGYSQEFNVNQNAFGFGGMLGLGAGIPLTDVFGIEPGFYVQYYPTNLEGYDAYKPNFGVYLRIMLAFGQGEKE